MLSGFEERGKNSKISPILGVILILTLVFYALYIMAKKIFIIKINSQKIDIQGIFKRFIVNEADIASIDFFSKASYYLLIGQITIVTEIELITGERIIIADPFYRNIGKLKQVIAKNFKEKIIPYISERKIKSSSFLQVNDFEKIAGNPYTCFNTLLLAGMIISFFLMQFLPNKVNDIKFASLIMSVVLYFGLGLQMNYFLISGQDLIVKNHYFFWFTKIYKIENIIAVNFENPYRRSEALKIVTNDFESKLYGAGSLREKDWKALKEKTDELGICFIP